MDKDIILYSKIFLKIKITKVTSYIITCIFMNRNLGKVGKTLKSHRIVMVISPPHAGNNNCSHSDLVLGHREYIHQSHYLNTIQGQ